MKHFPLETVQAWTLGLLKASGLGDEQAAQAVEVFLRAHRRGVGHHDLSFLPQRLRWLKEEGVNPRPELTLVSSYGATEVWDGDQGLGEVCCTHVTRRSMELARKHGIGFASVRRSNHFLAAAPYAEMGAEEGFFLLVFSNTDPCMAAPGGVSNIIGNDPMGYGIGRTGAPPLILDICMAYSSLGNLRALAAAGEKVPAYWGTDRTGQSTSDPQAILEGGSVSPMGRHKGFGLALMTEILTGVLSGGSTGNQVRRGGGINTHNQAAIAFHLEAFGGAGEVQDRVQDLSLRLQAQEKNLRLPGERAAVAMGETQEKGFALPEELVTELKNWSQHLGVQSPD